MLQIIKIINIPLFLGRKPWGDLSAREVYDEVVVQGSRLPLDRRTMPRNLFHLIDVGLNDDKDYLDLHEVRDMLLITRVGIVVHRFWH